MDRTSNDFENGCVGFLDDFPFGSGLSKTYDSILDSLNNGSASFYTFMFNVSENDDIIWVYEKRIGERYRVTDKSTRVMVIEGSIVWNLKTKY